MQMATVRACDGVGSDAARGDDHVRIPVLGVPEHVGKLERTYGKQHGNRGTGSLRDAYKAAVEKWIAAIREEENLATPDHTVPAVDVWEHAGFDEEEARDEGQGGGQAYEDALRKVDFNF